MFEYNIIISLINTTNTVGRFIFHSNLKYSREQMHFILKLYIITQVYNYVQEFCSNNLFAI